MISTRIFNRMDPDSESLDLKHNRVATRNGDIFYAINSTIRYSNSGDDYRLLDADIKFEIQGIKSNSNGTLLAVYNESNLVVLSLGSLTTSTSPIKQYTIGSTLLKNVGIACILWNRTAKGDSNLVILCHDNTVRSFDLEYSLTEPLKTFSLSARSSNKRGLASNSIIDPVAITFGSEDGRLSSLLNLYITNKDGDVFSIYPFLPVNGISATKEQIEELFNESVLLLNLAIEGEQEIDKDLAINQLRFVNSIWKQLPFSSVEIREDNKEYYNSKIEDIVFRDNYTIQGPFSIQPFPECLYDDEVADIVTIKSDQTDLLVVSFLKNGLIALLPDHKLTMKWNEILVDKPADKSSHTLSLLDHVKPSSQSRTQIAKLDTDILLIENNGNLSQIQFHLDGTKPAELELLAQNIKSYGGNGVIYDVFKNTKSRIILSNSTVKLIEGPIDDSKPSQGLNESFEVADGYKSTLNKSAYLELSKILSDVKNFRLPAPSNLNISSEGGEASLAELNSVTRSIMKSLKDFHKAGILINYKLTNINDEFHSQINASNEILEKVNRLRKVSESIENVIKRQNLIAERFATLKNNVLKTISNIDLPLSGMERKWFKEISALVFNFNKSLIKNQQLHEHLKLLKDEVMKLSISETVESENYGWGNLNSVLRKGKSLLDATQNDLKSSLKDLNNQLGTLKV